MSPDEEWLRMLVKELTPVLKIMRNNNLPASKTLDDARPRVQCKGWVDSQNWFITMNA